MIRTAAEFSLLRERPREELVDALQKILRRIRTTPPASWTACCCWPERIPETTVQVRPCRSISLLSARTPPIRLPQLAPGKSISVSAELGPTLVVIDGDDTALRRLLLILVDNAIKYPAPAGRLVDLRLRSTRVGRSFAIADTGIGIAASDLATLFHRFWRCDKVVPAPREAERTGLAIARWIVERHRGEIDAASQAGQGSTFTVELPLPPPRTHCRRYRIRIAASGISPASASQRRRALTGSTLTALRAGIQAPKAATSTTRPDAIRNDDSSTAATPVQETC